MAYAGAHTTGRAGRLDPKEITGTNMNTNPYFHNNKKLTLVCAHGTKKVAERQPK
jgi:hypothetical protein